MTTLDSCFVCLENSSNKVCDQCNVRAHNKCWVLYMQDQKGDRGDKQKFID